MVSPLLTIDVGHPPRPAGQVEDELLEGWSRARNSPHVRVLKIIHGYGSGGKGASTREVVRGWLHQHRERFRAIIDGEEYGLFHEGTRELRKETGAYSDGDLDAGNRGIVIVWLK